MSLDPRYTGPQLDAFHKPELPKERQHAPYAPSSATSQEAAKRVSESPAFHGNRLTCLRAIAKYSGNITRKQIAEMHFASQQQYVTGPVRVLIEEGLVYEEPAQDRHGVILRNKKGQVIPRRIDHSAVLKLTNKGRAVAA